MYSPTYAELKSNLEMELDLEDETFITPDEMLAYFNEAIDMVESTIHTIYEDYFLTSANLALVSGTATVSLPSDIYAQKVRGMFYNDGGSRIYEIKRIRKLADIQMLNLSGATSNLYQYMITNSSSVGLKFNFYPTPSETSATNVTVFFLRNAKKFAVDADVCDIPEFTPVIVQYVRWKCISKEMMNNDNDAGRTLQAMKQEMVETLTARIPDEDNKIPLDLSFYDDFDGDGWGNY